MSEVWFWKTCSLVAIVVAVTAGVALLWSWQRASQAEDQRNQCTYDLVTSQTKRRDACIALTWNTACRECKAFKLSCGDGE